MAIKSTLIHRVLMPERTGAALHPTLILLHGRGTDEEDLLGLVPALDKRLLVLSARAPMAWEPGGGFTWYEVQEMGAPEVSTFNASYEALVTFVQDAIAQYPVMKEKLFLLGFSMGAVMSLVLGLTHPDLFRGIVAHSGYVPEGAPLAWQWGRLSHPRFFLLHGTEDPVIPVSMGRRALELLRSSSAHCTYREYPIGHQITEESLGDVRNWMSTLLEAP